MRRARAIRLAVLGAGVVAVAAAVTGSVVRPPVFEPAPVRATAPMGWNSWDSGITLTEQSVRETIDAMVSDGMRDAGYRYVDLDAGWAAPQRDSSGDLVADPVRFPHGMAAVAAYAHEHGMSLGLYSSPFNEICGQSPATASRGHELQDARRFAGWGVDLLKYDWCRTDANHDEQVRDFARMRDALRSTGRGIVYMINPNSSADARAGVDYDWSAVADSARSSDDLIPMWRNIFPEPDIGGFDTTSVRGVADEADAALRARPSRPGYWPDPDMLVVGQSMSQFLGAHLDGLPGTAVRRSALSADETAYLARRLGISPETLALLRNPRTLSPIEEQAHLSLWAMLSAPLIAGNDIRTMSESTRALLTDAGVIAIDQDSRVAPAVPLPREHRILTKPLSDGSVAVALLNPGEHPLTLTTSATEAGLAQAQSYAVRDIWAATTSVTDGRVVVPDIPAHGVVLLRITPAA
ncbi:glycoside hydrolase family 27 protein [Nocardia cerradoensis]|uniref:glycoside hydrolase family 27 protein n=1 Tax=Nocardia cerradoensis TaxID=85688 RepID=UPI001FDFE9A7|nr:glycoside hydrolase family 27 protein [Nocardia cerradoensis]